MKRLKYNEWPEERVKLFVDVARHKAISILVRRLTIPHRKDTRKNLNKNRRNAYKLWSGFNKGDRKKAKKSMSDYIKKAYQI